MAKALFERGVNAYEKADYPQAMNLFEQVLRCYRPLPGTEIEQGDCFKRIGWVLYKQGHYSEALAQYDAALQVYGKLPGTKKSQADCLYNKGTALRAQSCYGESQARFQEALEIYRKLPGAEKDQADCLANIGLVLRTQERLGEALAQDEAALALYRKLPGMEREQAACFMNIAVGLHKQGHYQEALEKEEISLTLYRKMRGTEKDQAICLKNIGLTLCSQGRYGEALALYRQLPGTEREQADCHVSIGFSFNMQGRADEAVKPYETALALYQKLPGTEIEQARCLVHIGVVLDDRGHYSEALARYETALALYRQLQGMEEKQGDCLVNIGVTLDNQGYYGEALARYEAALALYRQLPGMEKEQGDCFTNIGNALNHQSRYVEALEKLESALALYHKLPDRELDEADCLLNIGSVLDNQERYPEAIEKYAAALEIFSTIPGEEKDQADCMLDLGVSLCHLGRKAEALEKQKTALALYRKLPESEKDQADCLGAISMLLRTQGDYGQAGETFTAALKLYGKLAGVEKNKADCLNNLGLCEAAQGRLALARAILLDAHRSHWDFFVPNLPLLTQAQKETFFSSRFDLPDPLYLLALQTGQPETGLEAALLYKGLLEEALQQERKVFLRHATPELRIEFQSLEASRRQWANLAHQMPKPQSRVELTTQSQAALQQTLVKLQDEITSREQALARRNLAFARQMALRRVTTQTLHQTLDGLGQPVVLVEYVKFKPINFRTGESSETARYAAFILRQGTGGAAGVDLGPAVAIDDAITSWRLGIVSISEGKAVLNKGAEARCLEQGLALRKLVLDPLLPHLGGCKRLLIASDDQLHQLPFEALPAFADGVGQRRYLLDEGYAISYLSSGRELVRLAQSKDDASSASAALLMAGPDYELSLADQAKQARQLARADDLKMPAKSLRLAPAQAASYTPAAELKVASVMNEKLLRPLTLASGGDPAQGAFRAIDSRGFIEPLAAALRQVGVFSDVEVTTGAHALEWRLKHLRQSPRLLQILTHGLYINSPENEAQTTGASERKELDNPLLRSLLAMAGANRTVRGERPPEGLDDGLLTAYEVAGLDLEGCELVALTACQSALGQTRAGRSVGGLRWAFMQAGVRSLLASQWSVPEVVSREQMQCFYRLWLAKESPMGRYEAFLESQRQALRAAREQHHNSHPWLWAGFVYVGDPGGGAFSAKKN